MKPIHIPCPNCGKNIIYDTTNPFRPFCNERCKLIDLGAWAAEEHVITETLALDENITLEDLEKMVTDPFLH